MEATNQPTPVILSEAEVDEVAEMFPHVEYQPDVEAMPLCAFCDGAIDDHKANCVVPHVHALCQTVRTLLRWKQEALPLLTRYDNLAETFGGKLGSSKVTNLERGVATLRKQIQELRNELDGIRAAYNA